MYSIRESKIASILLKIRINVKLKNKSSICLALFWIIEWNINLSQLKETTPTDIFSKEKV